MPKTKDRQNYCINGQFKAKKDAKISVCDHGFLYGDAVYETLRTINGEPWLLPEHLKRLCASARAVGIQFPWTNKQLYLWISKLHKKNAGTDKTHKESRIRITVSRGCNNFDFTTSKKPTLVIEATKLILPPKKIYKEGVAAITFPIERTCPLLKSTSMLPTIIARKEAKKQKAYEAFLIDRKGNITEGSISNIFIVRKGKIITPNKGMLSGTVRNYLVKHLNKKLKISFANIPHKKLYESDEVFLTSTVKGVVPVVKIDGRKIGNGKPGPITKEIWTYLTQRINET